MSDGHTRGQLRSFWSEERSLTAVLVALVLLLLLLSLVQIHAAQRENR